MCVYLREGGCVCILTHVQVHIQKGVDWVGVDVCGYQRNVCWVMNIISQ